MFRAFTKPKSEKGELFCIKCFSLYPESAANQKPWAFLWNETDCCWASPEDSCSSWFSEKFCWVGRVARRAGAKPLLTGGTCFPFLFQKLHYKLTGAQEPLGPGFAESWSWLPASPKKVKGGIWPLGRCLDQGSYAAVWNTSASIRLWDGFLGNLDYHSAFIALFEVFIDLFIFMAGDFCCIVSVGLYLQVSVLMPDAADFCSKV